MRVICTLTFCLLMCGCRGEKKAAAPIVETLAAHQDDSAVAVRLPPLVEGNVVVSDEDFGPVIELSGTSHPVDEIFKVSESQMIIKDDYLIVKNHSQDNFIKIFKLPGFEYVASAARAGRGPGEFVFPKIFKAPGDELLCYIYESTKDELYSLDKNFEIKALNYPLSRRSAERSGDKQFQSLSDSMFLYVESTSAGKAVFEFDIRPDSVVIKEAASLAFLSRYKSWASYIGDFGVNAQKGRMVYAYKYFKRLVFFDIKNGTSRTLDFKGHEDIARGGAIMTLGPDNVTYYWGISPQKEYVYCLYSGRTPTVVARENSRSSGYIYVEQFDWNGNPVRKFKLDRWGYFCVDESEETIYLSSTTDEHPFYTFQIPALQ